jgi:two-component system sensor histidine kinase VicK
MPMPNINDNALMSYAGNEQVLNLLPIPIAVLKGDLSVIGFANDAMFKLWKRDRSVATIGLPLTTAFPETSGSFLRQLKQVFQTGVSYMDEEVILTLNDGSGKSYSIFIDYTYQAIRAENGMISGILVTAQDVTHKVSAKKLLYDTTEQLKDSNYALASSNEECMMAIETAKLGTWKLSADRRELIFSDRSAEIYGFAEGQVSLRSALDLVRADYRESVDKTFKGVVHSGEMFELEYPIRPLNSDQDRWIRVTGRVMMDVQRHSTILKGTLMDITGQKMELIRKNEFIGMASHELKTPLTSLNGLLQLLSRRPVVKVDNGLVEMAALALLQVRKMTRMINSFVDISRLEAGKFKLDLTDFDLGELVSEQLNEVRVSAPQHQFVQEGCQALKVRADRVKIGVLLANLIANAIKYTPAGKSIRLSCFQKPGYAEVSVADQGCGVAEKDKSSIFDRFSNIEHPQVKNSTGFGIGLFLCAEIIKYHRGEIWVENNKEVGCTFYFRLPHSDQQEGSA